MNQTARVPLPRFYCLVQDQVQGPFDTIELAGQLKSTNIEADTLICSEGQETWLPFRNLPEFFFAQEMSIEEIARYLEKKEQGRLSPRSTRKNHPLVWPMTVIVVSCLTMVAAVLIRIGVPAPPPSIPPASYLQVDDPNALFSFARQYSADCTVYAHSESGSEKLYVDNGKIREDVGQPNGVSRHLVLRPDLKLMFFVIVDQNRAIQSSYDPNDPNDQETPFTPKGKFEALGREAAEGSLCAKYKVTSPDGLEVFYWVADHGVPVKITLKGGSVTLLVTNYKTGPQDPALFEIPRTYHIIPVPPTPSTIPHSRP